MPKAKKRSSNKAQNRANASGGSGKRWLVIGAVVIGIIVVGSIVGVNLSFQIGEQIEAEGVDQQVDLTVMVSDSLSSAAINAANVYVWKVNPLEGDNFRDVYEIKATVSTGIADFQNPFYEGEDVWVQVRQAAPTSADPYMSPIYEGKVPQVSRANDEVSLGTINVRDFNTAPTLVARDQGGSLVENDTALFFFDTTDTLLEVTYSAVDSDDWWGMIPQDPNFVGDLSTLSIADPTGFLPDPAMVQDGNVVAIMDGETGYWYAVNVLMIKSGAAQPISNYDLDYSAGGTAFYVFFIPTLADDSSISDDDREQYDVTFSAAAVADAVFDIDLFDLTKWEDMSNGIYSGSLNPTALTSKVA